MHSIRAEAYTIYLLDPLIFLYTGNMAELHGVRLYDSLQRAAITALAVAVLSIADIVFRQ
jgi:hypothetical protein